MPEYIDVLTPTIDRGAVFTVNTAVASVDLLQTFPGAVQTMWAGGGASIFRNGDCFKILSVGYFIPESYVHAQYPAGGVNYPFPIILLQLKPVGAGGPFNIREFGNNGQFRIPFCNYEMAVGTFSDPTGSGVNDAAGFSIQTLFPHYAGLQRPQISMTGVPAVLDGTVVNVTPFVKVMHNFPLT